MDSTPLKPSEQTQRALESAPTKEVPPVLSALPQTKAVPTVVMDSTQNKGSDLSPIPVDNSRSPEVPLGTQSLVANSSPGPGSGANEAALSESPKPADAVNAPVVTQNSANEPLLQPTVPIPDREPPIIPPDQTQRPPEPLSPQELLSVLSALAEDISPEDFSSKKTSDDDAAYTFHQVRRIAFNGRSCAVITQNKNGPCPMLALANVLLLRGELSLPEGLEIIDGEEIIARLSNYLFSQTPEVRNFCVRTFDMPRISHKQFIIILFLIYINCKLDS
ncbi:unnamed protein product [Dibothriocephalus latus]|uniref:Ubiquitin carboxyl-terminal hydrolase n=1 Tax=Dibothriocephalus latus TaxID=60516 RepID=A0A3P7NZ24_DIBLA|nr:unnamed protein product [Dibothriocephalus latus]